MKFRSIANLHIQQIPQLKCGVFLDSNCLALKNCDSIFRKKGVQWVNDKGIPCAAIVINSKFGCTTGQRKMTDLIAEIENDENYTKKSILELEKLYAKLQYCVEMDVSGYVSYNH